MYSIFEQLLKKKGIRTIEVAKATGIHPTTFYDWKSGKSKPKQDKMKKVADYFGVTLEYLISGETTTNDGSFCNKEAIEIAERILDNNDLRMLFYACHDVNSDNLKIITKLAKALKNVKKD